MATGLTSDLAMIQDVPALKLHNFHSSLQQLHKASTVLR